MTSFEAIIANSAYHNQETPVIKYPLKHMESISCHIIINLTTKRPWITTIETLSDILVMLAIERVLP